MTVSDLAVRLRMDEPGFLRKRDGWEAVLPHLLVAQPPSRRVIDLPRLSIQPVPHHATLSDLSTLLDEATVGFSPVVDGTALIGRVDHRRVRAWLAGNAQTDVAAELSHLRLATLGLLHDLNNILLVIDFAAERHTDAGAREAASQAGKLVRLLQSLHSGASIGAKSLEVAEVVTRLL